MLQAATFKFLKELKKNNNKPWFDSNRKNYESSKADFLAHLDSIIEATAKFDVSVGNLKGKDCIFRINRDIRFSKDKSPYKTNMGAYISAAGKKVNAPGYYFHCEPGQSFAAGGLYMPEPADLSKIRQEIDYNFEEWTAILQHKVFKKHFAKGVEGIETLSRPPKGYTEDNPAINFLKMKSFIVSRPFSDAELMEKNIVKEIAKTYEAMQPMIKFLTHAMK